MLNRFTIQTKVILILAVPLLMLAGLSLWSYSVGNQVYRSANEAANVNVPFAIKAKELDKNVVQIQQFLTDISATRGQDGLDDGFEQAEKNYQSFVSGLKEFQTYYENNGDNKRLEQIETIKERVDAYYAMGQKMARQYVAGGPGSGNLLMDGFDSSAVALSEVLQPFTAEQVALAQAQLTEATDHLKGYQIRSMIFSWVAIGFSLLVGLWVTRQITGALKTLKALVEHVDKSKDLTDTVPVEGVDECASTQRSFNNLVRTFNELIKLVLGQSDTLSAASTELSSTIEEVKHVAEAVSESSDHSYDAIKQVNLDIKDLEQSGQRMNEQTEEIVGLVKAAVADTEESKSALAAIQTAMGKISESSAQVVRFTDEIGEIGTQTNLLSLNASIEAAKAGEYGRGFAVVAQEVKMLSEKSSAAIEQITSINEVSNENVRLGNQVVSNANDVIGQLIEKVSAITEKMEEVAREVEGQQQSTSEISLSAERVDKVSMTNASAMTELAESIVEIDQTVHELNKMAEDVKDHLDVFRV